jgi:hypothetical protein
MDPVGVGGFEVGVLGVSGGSTISPRHLKMMGKTR